MEKKSIIHGNLRNKSGRNCILAEIWYRSPVKNIFLPFIYLFFLQNVSKLLIGVFFFNIFVLQSISSFIIHFKSIFKQFSHKLDMALQVETFMESN